jgi:3-hydroxybutyryl-CoA dehydratase
MDSNLFVGQKFEQKFKVDELVYSQFIRTFNDNNILHTNLDYARSKGFEGKVMHGNILNGFISFFVGECLPIKNVIIHSQEINFKKPVFLNDELIFNAEVIEIYESVKTVLFKFSFSNQCKIVVAKGKIQLGII